MRYPWESSQKAAKTEEKDMNYGALHPESRAFLSSWQALNGLSDQSETGSAMSKDASSMIGRIFLAQRASEGVFTFKTVGADLKLWTGRDLRDHDVASLFHGADRNLIRALLESAITGPGPALARAAAFGAGFGQRTEVEWVFLPLTDKSGADRVLGLFQPINQSPSISKPVLRFSLTALLPPTPEMAVRQGLRLVVSRD
ncbi:MAG: PAS domain-containing protein [Hyphomonadaceae bacterium]|nr:PAS domain-containing protein [Hyphomonadaceae bacterium]